MAQKLIFGCGYLGLRVARNWLAQGCTVAAVTRRPDRAAALAREGLRPILADVTRPETLACLPAASTILWSIGYDRGGTVSRQQLQVDGLRSVLDALPSGMERLIYVSSTSVYGPAGGDWVDEDTPPNPARDAGRVMLAAERLLAAHPRGAAAVILRLAGIYGPGRIPRTADLLAGRPLALPAAGNVNLIHVDDAAGAVLAAESLGQPRRVYLISDGHPVPRRAFYRCLAELLGVAAPQFVEPGTLRADQPMADRSMTDKRIDNRRMRGELKVRLSYPSYREGLAAIIRDRGRKPQDWGSGLGD
jgi:nucleoside-diphosphate-sugar epimerase